MAMMEVSMSGKRYTNEFKSEAVKQVFERGHSVAGMANPSWVRWAPRGR